MFIDLFRDEHSLLKDLTAEKKENMKIWREKKWWIRAAWWIKMIQMMTIIIILLIYHYNDHYPHDADISLSWSLSSWCWYIYMGRDGWMMWRAVPRLSCSITFYSLLLVFWIRFVLGHQMSPKRRWGDNPILGFGEHLVPQPKPYAIR